MVGKSWAWFEPHSSSDRTARSSTSFPKESPKAMPQKCWLISKIRQRVPLRKVARMQMRRSDGCQKNRKPLGITELWARLGCHPEHSRFLGEAKDLPRN